MFRRGRGKVKSVGQKLTTLAKNYRASFSRARRSCSWGSGACPRRAARARRARSAKNVSSEVPATCISTDSASGSGCCPRPSRARARRARSKLSLRGSPRTGTGVVANCCRGSIAASWDARARTSAARARSSPSAEGLRAMAAKRRSSGPCISAAQRFRRRSEASGSVSTRPEAATSWRKTLSNRETCGAGRGTAAAVPPLLSGSGGDS